MLIVVSQALTVTTDILWKSQLRALQQPKSTQNSRKTESNRESYFFHNMNPRFSHVLKLFFNSSFFLSHRSTGVISSKALNSSLMRNIWLSWDFFILERSHWKLNTCLWEVTQRVKKGKAFAVSTKAKGEASNGTNSSQTQNEQKASCNTQRSPGTPCQRMIMWLQGEIGKCLEKKPTEAW